MTSVSIVIPTHNRARLLPLAVESALGQSHPRVEVVVVDDGSEDETPEILREMAGGEPRLKVVRHPQARGAPASRNAGVREAGGEAIGFLDDDCVFHPEKVERQLRALTPDRGVVYCRQMIRQLGGEWEVEGKAGAGTRPVDGILNIGTNTILLARETFMEEGGFDEELPRLQDFDLLLRLSRRTGFSFLPQVLVRGVMVQGGITLTPGPLARAADLIMAKHTPHLSSRELSTLSYLLGKLLLVDGLQGPARRQMARAVRTNPASLRAWAGLAASLLGPGPARMVRGWRRERRRPEEVEGWPRHPLSPTGPGAEPE